MSLILIVLTKYCQELGNRDLERIYNKFHVEHGPKVCADPKYELRFHHKKIMLWLPIDFLRAIGMGEIMDEGHQKGPSCQSCGMPMEKPEDFGTCAEGDRNDDYCHFCFQGGRFTEPDMTIEQMIEKIAGMAPMMRMTEAKAREMAMTFIPRLKRWR